MSDTSNQRPIVAEHPIDNLNVATKVVAAGRPDRGQDTEINPAISLTSTFNANSSENGPKGYGRFGNSTWSALEEAISTLEGGKTLVYSSGMAAINSIFSLFGAGSVIVATKNGYTGTMRILKEAHDKGFWNVRFIDISNNDEISQAMIGAHLLWIESPTNPALEVADLPFIIEAGHAAGAVVAVDNTFATPLRQQPLALGAEISMNSVTKYISGHSDVILGSVSTTSDTFFEKLHTHRSLGGAIPGSFETWLALRGIRTMAIRLERAESNAMELAKRLSSHPAVERVRFPGLESDPFHERAKMQMSGFGAVIAIEVRGGAHIAQKACESSKLVTFATSLGGVETLWERRHRWGTESPEIPTNLVRIAVGIEDIEDLWLDIDQALNISQR